VDTDADGLTDATERSIGTSIYHADTDGDGRSDRQEVRQNSDPCHAETSIEPLPLLYSSAQSTNLKVLADQVRNADLEVIATYLGLEQDRHDSHKWRDRTHIMSISGGKFMDWFADQGGGGAIDFVMHVQQMDFKAAVEWLSDQDLSAPVTKVEYHPSHADSEERRSLDLPLRNEQRWQAARDYLSETRKLPVALSDRLYEKGLIYADEYQNLVFLRYALNPVNWSRGKITGASLGMRIK
jgi:Protein of unknown function (DUF3991)/Bacterial TSP3 repeat